VEAIGTCFEQLFRPPKVDFSLSEAYLYRIINDTLFSSNIDKSEAKSDYLEARKSLPYLLGYNDNEDVNSQGLEISNYQFTLKKNATGGMLLINPSDEMNFGYGYPGKNTVTKQISFKNDSQK